MKVQLTAESVEWETFVVCAVIVTTLAAVCWFFDEVLICRWRHGEYDLVEVINVTTQTPESKEEQQALLGVLRHRVLEVIGDLQEETVMGVFTINGLSKRTIMKRLRKVKAYSEHSLWLAY